MNLFILKTKTLSNKAAGTSKLYLASANCVFIPIQDGMTMFVQAMQLQYTHSIGRDVLITWLITGNVELMRLLVSWNNQNYPQTPIDIVGMSFWHVKSIFLIGCIGISDSKRVSITYVLF